MDIRFAPHICAQIGYENEDGVPIHSDICWQDGKGMPGDPEGRVTFSESYQEFVIENLREWFAKGGGTGYFYVGTYNNVKEALA
jgi:hypothetical protein